FRRDRPEDFLRPGEDHQPADQDVQDQAGDLTPVIGNFHRSSPFVGTGCCRAGTTAAALVGNGSSPRQVVHRSCLITMTGQPRLPCALDRLCRMIHPCRRTTANHTFGPPSENLTSVNSGFTSHRAGWTDSTSQSSAKASYSSSRDTRRGPSVPGSSSLKHSRKSWPPGSTTRASPWT